MDAIQFDHTALTPLMRQYAEIKETIGDALLFFQVGDFYELFFEDAKKASSFLGIALTKRGTYKNEPIPLCGVPVHALEHYLNKLIKGGFKVALCDQLEEARPGIIVKRGITQVLTPGTLTESALLDAKHASYLLSFFPTGDSWGLLFGELLTARLFGTVLSINSEKSLDSELIRFVPDEILIPRQAEQFKTFFSSRGYYTSVMESTVQQFDMQSVLSQFNVQSRQALESQKPLLKALYCFFQYIQRGQRAALEQFTSVQIYKPEEFLVLDSSTARNLELIKNNQDGSSGHTLFEVVDQACTAMGSRTIKRWITCPLVDRVAIEERYDAIDAIQQDIQALRSLQEYLRQIGDLERLVGKIALGRSPLSDYLSLCRILTSIPHLKKLLQQYETCCPLATIEASLHDFDAIVVLLKAALSDDQSSEVLIKKGFDKELDTLRELVTHAQDKVLSLEQQEQQRTGINSLKIRFNGVYGYAIEVTKVHLSLVPIDYVRLQTLVGKERYTMPALQQLEHDIRSAQNSISQVESELIARIKKQVAAHIYALRSTAYALGRLDALISFADIAYSYGYVRPLLHEGTDIVMKQCRHPVVERTLAHRFIPNDVALTDAESLWIVTGPNMGGKSTFLRQVALCSIMAQAGSFVPAQSARLPLLDRIFTRIGAGDNLSGGKSTFLVEMEETALICSQATSRSLVILDEVGRGTSTFDGLAIAQAVVEYVVQKIGARSIFATHYHELSLLKEQFTTIANYHACTTKTGNGIVFLYKMVPGVADGSFGVEVAKLANLPVGIIDRAQEILQLLAAKDQFGGLANYGQDGQRSKEGQSNTVVMQPCESRHSEYDQIMSLLNEIAWDELSPKKAFDLLWSIKNFLNTPS